MATNSSRRLQHVRNRAVARISHEGYQAGWTDVDVDAIRLSKNGVARGYVECINARATVNNENPRLLFRLQAPRRIWRQIDLFEREM